MTIKGKALHRIDIFKLADSMDFDNPYRLGYPKKEYMSSLDADVHYTLVKVSFMNLVDDTELYGKAIWRTAVWSRPSTTATMHCGWEFDSTEKGPALAIFCAVMELTTISIKDLRALGLRNIKEMTDESMRAPLRYGKFAGIDPSIDPEQIP